MSDNLIDQNFFDEIASLFKKSIKQTEDILKVISDEFINEVQRPCPPEIYNNNKFVNPTAKFYLVSELESMLNIKITNETIAMMVTTSNVYHLNCQVLKDVTGEIACIMVNLPHVGYIISKSSKFNAKNLSNVIHLGETNIF